MHVEAIRDEVHFKFENGRELETQAVNAKCTQMFAKFGNFRDHRVIPIEAAEIPAEAALAISIGIRNGETLLGPFSESI